MHNSYHIGAVVPAAGSGNRMNSPLKKQFLELEGKEVLEWTLINLLEDQVIDEVVLVVPTEEVSQTKYKVSKWIETYSFSQNIKVVSGGKTRQDSVYKGIEELSPEVDVVAVHDGVRPFVDKQWLRNNLDQLNAYDGIVAAIPAVDTLKTVDENQMVISTLERSVVWQIQTPQVFWRDVLYKSYENAAEKGFSGTDDASLVEWAGGKIKLCSCNRFNIKITTPEDLIFGEAIIKQNKAQKELL